MKRRVKVLFVCLGNICRSPTAEGVFRRYLQDAGLADKVEIDSAGTGDYHIGEAPDPRACQVAAQRGYDLTSIRARQVTPRDFYAFDYLLAMDEQNLRVLTRMAPPEHADKLRRFSDFSSRGASEIPDPYAGGPQGFEDVLELIEDAAQGLLRHVSDEIER